MYGDCLHLCSSRNVYLVITIHGRLVIQKQEEGQKSIIKPQQATQHTREPHQMSTDYRPTMKVDCSLHCLGRVS